MLGMATISTLSCHGITMPATALTHIKHWQVTEMAAPSFKINASGDCIQCPVCATEVTTSWIGWTYTHKETLDSPVFSSQKHQLRTYLLT